ncbi:hypothetical protein PILCRDRAFT_810890 [Piloderma croceum F 1598]|uniref:BTB domain-containing protein n=1 Tax=Piloderma croceum (strain F 1598) TaxID=765440 RepID=A0A0C3CPM4_PILCF|nr:hypothetical protein PILCRDRAFT_810890 [Piloderma croceum F 1598]
MSTLESVVTTAPPQHDTQFYFESVTFLVEDMLFKVPKLYFERNSSIFRDMFALPTNNQSEGSNDENPIKLESIEKVEFQRLLTAMFPDLSRYTPKPVVMGREEWISVLKLSTLWTFRELRREAVDELSQMTIDPVDKVMLARDYRVEAWLMEGYTELIKRPGALSSSEKKSLGHETTVLLYEQREKALTRTLQRFGYANVSFDGLDTEVRETFWEEAIDIRFDDNAIQAASGFDGIGKDQSEPEREIPPKKSKKGKKGKH